MTLFTEAFSRLAPDYDVILSDVWGVVHDGITAHPEAGVALSRFRARGGSVVLITNAPRPGEAVSLQIDKIGVPRNAYDGIVSSGDVTRELIGERKGQSIFHVGPERDRPIFESMNAALAPLERADYVVCSGLFDDDNETADDYRDMLGLMRERSLLMICGNPDVVVERGDRLVYCAGAIADLYVALGGEVIYAGKPYPPIYSGALRKAEAARRHPVELHRVLAIGDSLRTDVKGAASLGIDCLFMTAGIHAEELGGRDNPRPDALERIFAAEGVRPKAVMRKLVW